MEGQIDEGVPEDARQHILPEDKLPPELTPWRRRILWIARIFMLIGICWLIFVYSQIFSNSSALWQCIFCTYLALAGFLSGLVADFLVRHKMRVHESRKADRSEVEALIQEASNIRPRLTRRPRRPIDYDNKREKVVEEVRRLKDDVGPKGWTEFQVLPLDRLRVDFLAIEDLKALALSSLEDLKEYAEGEAFSYTVSLYYSWDEKIKSAISDMDELEKTEGKSDVDKDDEAEALRANLRSLLYHVADYEFNWARGSTIVSGIRICGATAVVIFTLMGILPLMCSIPDAALSCDFRLGVLNWGFLGVAGAIASALIGLRNAEEVEVGYTWGRRELWRAVLGAPLGFLAGILVFSALVGGVIASGSAVPDLKEPELSDAYLSIVWAVVAGMGFESVFQRVRRAVES